MANIMNDERVDTWRHIIANESPDLVSAPLDVVADLIATIEAAETRATAAAAERDELRIQLNILRAEINYMRDRRN